jgi:hypothetical protein
MGEFDHWARGFELSAASIDSDGVIKTFEADVQLLPGRYRTKFLVDGGWRLASDWPTENNEVVSSGRICSARRRSRMRARGGTLVSPAERLLQRLIPLPSFAYRGRQTTSLSWRERLTH